MRGTVTLGDVVEINPTLASEVRQRPHDTKVPFLPMSAVSEDGAVSYEERRPLGAVLKGYTAFSRGDVLLAKITPCFENGKATHLEDLPSDVGFGSTEFHVLRPGPDVDGRYLFHLVHSPKFREIGERRMGGTAGQKRVPTDFLRSYRMSLPPLTEQRRIAVLLDRADAVRRKREKARRLVDELLRSVFLEMFGDQVRNEKGWRVVPLGQLITSGPQNGLYAPASEYGTGTPIVRIDSFYDGQIVDSLSLKRVRLPSATVENYVLAPDDILINRVNSREYLGKSALVPRLTEPTVFESNMMRFRVDDSAVHPQYFVAALQSDRFRGQVRRRTKDAVNQASFNQSDLASFDVLVPPLPLQQRYADAFLQVAELSARAANSSTELGVLRNAVGRGVFELAP